MSKSEQKESRTIALVVTFIFLAIFAWLIFSTIPKVAKCSKYRSLDGSIEALVENTNPNHRVTLDGDYYVIKRDSGTVYLPVLKANVDRKSFCF